MAIDDQDINTEADLFKILESHKPGDVISIRAQRYEHFYLPPATDSPAPHNRGSSS